MPTHKILCIVVTLAISGCAQATMGDRPPFTPATGFAAELAVRGGPQGVMAPEVLLGHASPGFFVGLGGTASVVSPDRAEAMASYSIGPGARWAALQSESGRTELLLALDLRLRREESLVTSRTGVLWGVGSGVRVWMNPNLALSLLLQLESRPTLFEDELSVEKADLLQMGGVLALLGVL